MDGISATRVIRAQYPQTKVLVLTSSSDPGQIREAMDAGANGYFLKQVYVHEIETALRNLVYGELHDQAC
jgi:DNA-binding NarL/FixJ family response regulator